MRHFVMRLSAICAILASSKAASTTLIPVPAVPGSTETDVMGINDSNVIAGNYFTSDGAEHGFIGDLAGHYNTFNGKPGIAVRALSNSGFITGYVPSANRNYCKDNEYERSPDGTITLILKGNRQLRGTAAAFRTKDDAFVGDYCDMRKGVIPGYLGIAGTFKKAIKINPLPGQPVHPRGINNKSDVVGWYIRGAYYGFLLHDGVAVSISYPDDRAANTQLEEINNAGLITGYWTNEDFSMSQSFYLDTRTNVFTPIEIPNATFSYASGVNSAGLITVLSDVGSFIYCPKRINQCPRGGTQIVDVPGIHTASRGTLIVGGTGQKDVENTAGPMRPLRGVKSDLP
jgi:hypothetical protein